MQQGFFSVQQTCSTCRGQGKIIKNPCNSCHGSGVADRQQTLEVTIPAGQNLEFKPGSYHIMLEKPRAGLKIGDTIQVDFTLSNGEGFSAACEVKSPKAMSYR